jgi:DNA-binding CsgD family transcriptional regulator
MSQALGGLDVVRRRVDQVVQLAAEGATDREIAAKLGISPYTVATYWKRLRSKWNLSKRGSIILRHLKESLELVNHDLQEELKRREAIENELRNTTEQLQEFHGRSIEGWNATFTLTQKRLSESFAKANITEYYDRAMACGGALAYELKSLSPIIFRFIRFSEANYGLDADKILLSKQSFLDVVFGEDVARIYELCTGKPFLPGIRITFIYRHQRPELRWVMDTQQPLFDDNGLVVGIAGVVVDIHELVLEGVIEPKVIRVDRPAVPQPIYRPEGECIPNIKRVP